MDYPEFAEPDGSLLVSVRCLGLGISSKSPLPTAGLFSNLYVSMTKNPNVKNEKKYVKIEQSEHFPNHLKIQQQTQASAAASIKYKTIYTSEIFEEITDVFPSLLAKIRTVPGYDSKLKLIVYYSSSLTSGKEVSLAYQSFYESDLIRSVQQSSVFIVPLESEYCIASKAYVDIIQPLPSLLENSIFPVTALPSEKNPLTQNYVFYNELDTITPYLDAKEQCWEPKFVASIPLVFLSNLQQSLERSIAAWEKRLELERMRQGRFTSDAEALACGWNIIDISIKAARIGSTKSTIDRLNYIRQSNGSNPASVTAAASNPASTSDTPNIYVSQYPLSEDYPDIPTTSTNTASFSIPPASPSAPPRQDSGVVRHDSGVAGRPARRTGTGGFKFLGSSGGRGKVVTCDESLPSTFVEVYIEDLSKTFVDIVGRTNTEYHTMYPVYGSNLHANIVRKANTTAVAANEVVQLVHEEKEYPFHVFECSNKQFIPRRWRFANSHYSEANDVAEEPQHSFSSVNGKSTHFRKYISNCDHTYVRLDFCFETPAGKKKCVGTVAVPVTVKPGEKVRSWVPVRSFTHTLEEQYAIYDNIDILVEIDVTLSSTDLLQSINDRHVDVYAYNRSVTGDVTLPLPKDQNAPVPFEQHRQVIADCYEWMWQLGFTGHDPYILETSNSNNNSLTHPTDTTAFNTSSNNNNNNTNNTAHTTSTRKEGGGRGSVIGGAGSGWSLSEDEKDVNDVITLPKTFSASDLMNSDPTTANPTTNTASSGNPAATSSPPVNRRRSSRVQYINKAALPDSDDEAFDDDVTNAPAHGLIRGRSATSFETRKSLFEDDVDTAELIRTSEGENTVVDKFNALLIDLDEGVQGVSSNFTGTPNKIAAATSEVLQSLPQPPPQPLPTGSVKVTSVRSRVDFVLRLDWITHHVSELKKLLDEIRQSYLPDLRKKIRSEKAFRSSVLKKDTVVQPLPTNLHYQLLGIRKHCVACIDAHPKNTEIIHSLTCGALSPHLLGHKTGGLFHQESLLVQEKDKLFSLKESYLKKIKHFGDNGIRTDSEHSPYHILTELGRVVEGYEAMCVSVGRRRLLAISQALTVAINALTLKLNLVIEEQIPYQIANRWVETGFLVVFEGLLSVIGNERSMLEDTISAIDALTSYQVKILPNTTTSDAFHSGPPPPPPPSSPMPYDRSTSTSSTSEVHGRSMSGVRGTAQRPNDHIVDIDFDMKGREIQLYISEAAISRLSEEYQRLIRRQELVLKFYPVLFTQGIDIQQTMVTTFGGDSTSKKRSMTSVDLQNYVNRVAFNRLNAYCFRTQPIAGVRHTLTDIDQKKEIPATEYYASNLPSAPQTPAGKDNRMSGRFTSPAAPAKHSDIPIPMTSDRSPRASSQLAQSPATSSFMTAARPKSTDSEAATSLPEIHPLAQSLYDSIRHSTLTMKNVDLLIEVERLSLILGGIRITFCKSGKDRTGMAVTLEQARQLGERFSCGMASERLLKDANLMRVHGCRLMVAEKNIGKPVYSINILQAQFLPEMFRPPAQVCEDILKKDNS